MADTSIFWTDAPNDNDVWRVAHSGGSPELVIDDVLVQRDGGVGKQVAKFAISDDGNTIAFTLHGYAGESGYRSKCELFVRDATGGYRQLTNDEDNVEKHYLAISGDGSTIVFYVGSPQYKWYSIKSDGSAKIFLEDGGYNTGGPVLNYDGTKMFYYDHKANGGRLVNTDGSGGIDLFPVWNVGAITIAARTDLCINDDGHRISFISYGSISIMPSDHVVYIGYLDEFNAVPDAPVIESIAFDPSAMPRGDPDAVIVLTSEISDPQGLADIKRTSTDELVDGRLVEHYDYIPVSFYHAANDDGWSHDETAGDGIFSTAGTPAPKIDELDQMTVRMGVKDASGTVVVADTVLFIGEVPPTPTPTPTPTTPSEGSLVGYWNLNEGSGNIAYDRSGSGNDGTIHGATRVDNGCCEKALSFDGVDDYVETNPASFQSNDITVEAWIYPKSFSGYKCIIHKGDRIGANNVLFAFDLISNKIRFDISSNGNNWDSIVGTTSLELNKWYHVVGVYRSSDKFYAVYVNGTEDNSKTSTLSSLYHDSSKYWIGARYDNRQFVSGRYFNGIIDEVRIYNRALSEEEIQADMNECAPTSTIAPPEISAKGDCNGDGKITSVDALCALHMAVGKRVEDLVMDVSGDGRVTSLDARKILRVAAGLEELP